MTDLMSQLTELAGIGGPAILSWFLVFLRVGAMVAVLPAFGEQSLPVRVRLAVALAFSLVVFPAVAAPVQALSPLAMISETAIGLLFGLGLRLLVLALQTAGAIIAQSISLAQLFGAMGEPQPVVGNVLTVAALALAVSSGLHVRAAQLMIGSYELLPAGAGLAAADTARWGLAQVAWGFALAFRLAAPFVMVSFLYNIALGVISRAMPQLMVTMIGAPAIALGGIALLALSGPTLLSVWQGAVDQVLAHPLAMPQ